MNKAVLLTEDGLKKLHEELKVLKEERRKEVIERIQEIEEMLKNAEIIAHSSNRNIVSIGSTVVLKVGDREVKYTIVGANEANPAAGKISNESLVGKSLLGAKKGDKVAVQTPAGISEYEITRIE